MGRISATFSFFLSFYNIEKVFFVWFQLDKINYKTTTLKWITGKSLRYLMGFVCHKRLFEDLKDLWRYASLQNEFQCL